MTAYFKRRMDFWMGVPLIAMLSLGRRRMKAASQTLPRRILVIKLAAFGDTVLLIPTLRALRAALPTARIDWLVSPVNHSLAAAVPYVDETILLPDFSPFSLWAVVRKIRSVHYDLVFDFEQWAHGTALLAWVSGAPERLGFETPGCHKHGLFTQTRLKRYDRHERDDFFELASKRIPLSNNRELELWETTAGLQELKAAVPHLLDKPGKQPHVLLHPGCGSDGLPREWPLEKFVRLGAWLQQRFQAQIFITGGPEEAEKAGRLSASLAGSQNLSGRLPWQGTLSLVKRMNLVVSGNTGIMHVAAAWQIPQIAFHGPTDPRLWGPLNPAAKILQSPCPQCPCLRLGFEYHRWDSSCMDQISLESAYKAAESLLLH